MRVAAAEIFLDSGTTHKTTTEITEELTKGYVRMGETFNRDNLVKGVHMEHTRRNSVSEVNTSELTYSDLRRQQLTQDVGKYSLDQLLHQAVGSADRGLLELPPEDRFRIELMKKLFEALTGRKFSVGMLDIGGSSAQGPENQTAAEDQTAPDFASAGLDFGFAYSFQRTETTVDSLHVHAAGKVTTADGQTLDIDLNLNLSRTLQESMGFQLRAGAALKDPLVINFSGTAAELSARTFAFDIDVDGEKELIHQLHEQSGYIALDKNGNNQIDDGSELFGATSGNGFKDLAQYDSDGNGFIDEGDPVWEKLRIWVQHDNGSQSMFTLADKGIGALYLGYTDTHWELNAGKDSGQLAGKVRATGIFLAEDGSTGTLQQVDLVV